jgi:hypothetical protein
MKITSDNRFIEVVENPSIWEGHNKLKIQKEIKNKLKSGNAGYHYVQNI